MLFFNNFLSIDASKLFMSASYRSFQELWKLPIFFENQRKIYIVKWFSTWLRVWCTNWNIIILVLLTYHLGQKKRILLINVHWLSCIKFFLLRQHILCRIECWIQWAHQQSAKINAFVTKLGFSWRGQIKTYKKM